MTCALCDRNAAEPLRLGALPAECCLGCAWRLGRLIVESPQALVGVWPGLYEEDDGAPEPKVRLPDGRSVELRERTAALKQELPLEKRLALAEHLGQMGLLRERLLEAGWVLSTEARAELAQRALDLLFVPDLLDEEGVARLRPMLLPC